MNNCEHNVSLRARGQPHIDSNIILMATRWTCTKCGQNFRALGVPEVVTTDAPGSADDGETIVFPLVPVGEEPQVLQVGRC